MYEYNNYDPFSVCFNILKLKYVDYDNILSSANFLTPDDKINVFINLETVFRNLSMVVDLEKKILIHRDFDIIIISNILNLIAHYRRFFKDNNLDVNVFIYSTDFTSKTFNQTKYNEDFRSYYLLKFNENPKFSLLTNKLINKILPDIKTYCEFIPNVYFINAKDIDSSLVPQIVNNHIKNRKNLLITGDIIETEYIFSNNFNVQYIHKTTTSYLSNNLKGFINDLYKGNKEVEEIYKLYDSYNMYCTLLSTLGDKIRSVDKISGFGISTLSKRIVELTNINKIKSDSNPNTLKNLFEDEDDQKEFLNNYYCISINDMMEELTEGQKTFITNQIVDRIDVNSLRKLNMTLFKDHPLLLEGLL